MKANPGGFIPPKEVIGRDGLISNLWRVLKTRSVVLTAERRMGKTSIIKKMEVEHPADCLPKYRDLEQVHSPMEFARLVYDDVEKHLGRFKRLATRTRQFIDRMALDIGGVKVEKNEQQHWKQLLTHLVEDVVEIPENTLIFFWDEMPFMLDNIRRRVSPAAAMEVLDTLRALRQTHPTLRMVFTGSVGLHHILRLLKQEGYSNAPKNDMTGVDVPPLSAADAEDLAMRLIAGEGLNCSDPLTTARGIAATVDCVPYRIHYLIEQMVQNQSPVTAELAVSLTRRCLIDAQDVWNLRHYRERIDTYFSPGERLFALNLLDVLSTTKKNLSFDDAFNLLKSKIKTEDAELARQVLALLEQDHYLIRDDTNAYRFRLPLIAQWWRLDRGIGQ